MSPWRPAASHSVSRGPQARSSAFVRPQAAKPCRRARRRSSASRVGRDCASAALRTGLAVLKSADMSERILELTPHAVEKVLEARTAEGLGSDHGLRLAVTKGGCSGYEYSVKFAPQPSEGDLVFQADGISVYVARDSEPLLRGTVLDYVDSLHGAGLRLVNPNAARDYGYGSSFEAVSF